MLLFYYLHLQLEVLSLCIFHQQATNLTNLPMSPQTALVTLN